MRKDQPIRPKPNPYKSPDWSKDEGEGRDFAPNGQDLFAFNLGNGGRRLVPPYHD